MIPRRLVAAVLLLLLVVVLGLAGGPGLPADRRVVQSFVGWRTADPLATDLLILLTSFGGAPFLLALTAIAAGLVAFRDRAAAPALCLTVLGGRLLVEVVKLIVNRPRPTFDAHPVSTFSLSFPSGHATNTMMTFGAIALFALPERWRGPGLVVAVFASILVGATRPMLGVHWPTDVAAGWLLGGAWLILSWSLWQRFSAQRA